MTQRYKMANLGEQTRGAAADRSRDWGIYSWNKPSQQITRRRSLQRNVTLLTLTASNATLNHGSRNTSKLIASPNSRLIRVTSSATRRRSSPISPINVSGDRGPEGGPTKLSLTADKCGEVAGLSVERAIGIQCRLPWVQPTPKFTSWRFGSLEKLKDRSSLASRPSMVRELVSNKVSR